MEINPTIFKSYDVRGIYPEEINEASAELIAKAFLSLVMEKTGKNAIDLKIVAGHDVRRASGPLFKSAINELIKYGVKLEKIEAISTNDFYFALGYYKYDAGFMVTASHNPPEYGGFKMAILNQRTFDSIEFISGKELYQKIVNSDFSDLLESKEGVVTEKIIAEDHLAHILSFINIEKIKPLKIIIDPGNGMMGLLTPELLKKLPVNYEGIFMEPQEDFSNRPPNPLTAGAYKKLAEKVLEEQADMGIMYDVDGDRMFLVDEKGNFISGDMTLLLLSRPIIKQNSNAGVVYNLICSHAVPELVNKWGGRPIRSEVGYLNLARHMKEADGVISGEVSGHFAFKDNFYSDSAFIATGLALQAISEDGRPLSEIIKDYTLYARGDEINVKVDDIPSKLDLIRQLYGNNIKDEMDGITVEFKNWWFNVRASNTEPFLRITVEATDKSELKKRQAEILNALEIN